MSRRRNGYVLAAVIVGLTVFALAATLLLQAAEQLSRASAQARAEARLAVAMHSLQSRLGYLALTSPAAPGGLLLERPPDRFRADASEFETVSFNGTYRSADLGLVVDIRDEAGLFNLNAAAPAALMRLLESIELEPARARTLAAALQDYIDADEARVSDGADSLEYARLGLPAPKNAPLATAAEALSVLGWDEALGAQGWRRLAGRVTAGPAEQPLNLNTATPEVLAAALEIEPRQLAEFLEARAAAPFDDTSLALAALGLAAPAENLPVGVTPSRRFRLTARLADARGGSLLYFSDMAANLQEQGDPVLFLGSGMERVSTSEALTIRGGDNFPQILPPPA